MQNLTSEEYTFFSKFIRAVLSNPFTDERKILSDLISKNYFPEKDVKVHFFKKLQPLLNENIDKLDKRGFKQLSDFKGMESRLIYFSYIVAIYLNFVDDFDEFINHQTNNKNASLAFPKGQEILVQLERRGFSAKESLRLLELYYQFRRAYLFINNGLVGQSPSMAKLRVELWNNLFTFDVPNYHQSLWNQMEDFSLFLLGETGTGKGAAARAIGLSGHILYDKSTGCFRDNFQDIYVEANLSQYSENLIESELFGHKKGAFTGAFEQYQGLFNQCKLNGSLFLDEIGDISENIQIKLLKVLQERVFTPVGSHKAENFHGRIIAAANQPLQELRQNKKLRDDFYYRLCSDIIEIPTLRQRLSESPGELVILTRELVKRICHQEDENIVSLVIESLNKHVSSDYHWPGNVRELEQAIRRIILRGSYHGDTLRVHSNNQVDNIMQLMADSNIDLKELTKRYCQNLYEQLNTYEAVALKTNLDRRTVKKHVTGE